MFLTINAETHRNEWVLFTVTNAAGECIAVDICRHTELTALNGVTMPPTGTVFVTILETDTDRMRLANRALEILASRNLATFQWTIRDIVAGWGREGSRKAGSPVMCLDDGTTWSTVTACAHENNLTYSQLIKHLNGEKGYKTIKGKKYKRM